MAEHDEQPTPLIEIPASEFRIPASDDRGHDKRVNLRVHPDLVVMVQRILDSKAFPYQNTHQIYRHAIKSHCERLENAAPIQNSVLHRASAIMEILYEAEQQETFLDIIGKMGKQAGDLLSRGNLKESKELVKGVFDQVEHMPAGGWRDQYTKEIQEKWGYLLGSDTENVASLMDLLEE